MTNPIPDLRAAHRRIVKLPAEVLEKIIAYLLASQPYPKVTLSHAHLQAAATLDLLTTETRNGYELESCDTFGEAKPVRIPQTEIDHLPASDQFPVLPTSTDMGQGQ